ncbi:ABC transporter permease [Clostridium scatologenes]|uniref:Oligopeptide/dipeptide ABC transporter, permease protein n=1 Tax=Clostridium scatologenes TaxID=1548 RepID=A0A0E3GQK3_CLOSL|nr:ABC transporter permease [Clostridium scatologenes]AKA68721.1 oligopeptide/dipeptide ABC transporter, permease protein [Clostridium scatologenes]
MDELRKEKFKIIGYSNSEGETIVRPNITYWQDAWRRLKQNKVAILSLIILSIIAILCIIGPYLTPYKYYSVDHSIVNQGPNAQHYFGTDDLGRDMFARICKGGRVSLIIGLLGALIDATVGVLYGGIAGYFGGKIDIIMMRIIEVLASIPYLLVVVLLSLILGKGMMALIIAMTITGWVGMARLIRGQVLQIKEQEYVLAAQALGASSLRIILKHLLPNTIGVIIVAITFDVPSFIFGEAFLSFIGLGIQSPNTSWGAIASSAQQYLMFYPEQLFFPSLFISLTMLSFNLLGDGLRDALDPRLRQ